MSQPNRKYKRLEALFSETKPAEPDSIAQPSRGEVDSLKARVAALESELEAKRGQHATAPLKTTAFEAIKGTNRTFRPDGRTEETQKDSAQEFGSNAERIGKIGLPASIIAASLYLYLALQFGNWQLYAWSVDIWILALAVFVSIILARRGHVTWGTGLMLTAISLTFMGAVALIEGIGLLLGISSVLLVSLIAGQTLPTKAASRAIIFGVFSGITSILLDLYLPAYRLPQPDIIRVFLPGILGVVILLYGFITVRQFRNYKLRNKLIISFSVVALIGVAAISLISNLVVREQVTEQAGTTLHTLAQAQAQAIGNNIVHQVELLTALEDNQALEEAANVANASYQGSQAAIHAEINRLDEQWRAADSAKNDNDVLVKSVLSNALATTLTYFRKSFPDHVEIFVTDRYGASIASTDRTSDYNQADEEWWQAAYNEGRGAIFIGEPEFDESTQTYGLNMAIPVKNDKTGAIIGILRTTYRLAALNQMLISVHFGQTGVTDVIFPNGQMVGSDVAQEVVDPAVLAQLEAISGIYVQMEYDGVPQFVSRVPVASSNPEASYIPDLNWTVVTSQNSTEALSPIVAETRTMLFVSLGILLVAVLLGIFIAQYLAKPIVRLTTIANQVAAGDLEAQAKAETGDETGILATTFNMMTTRLRNMIGSLEQRVSERTHDLELASEVGQAVSEKIGDLTEMLSHAVELIRSRYGLYYTQIYLLDVSGRSLVLRSGTGEVGRQLLQRGHHLPIVASSLNSRAASMQKPVLVGDTQKSENFLPNPLLPLTRSELAVPLIVNGKVVGVLDMQSDQPDIFSEVNIPAFQVLASQLAIAIQNANLLSQTEEARALVEEHTRRLISSGWQDFLNAVDRSETLGYSFKENEIRSLAEPQKTALENALVIPIEMGGVNIGEVQLADEATRTWAVAEKEVARATMAQLAQHVENLRLLAQAERYRAEAEQAVRRLTREGWDSYLQEQNEETTTFAYNLNEVHPLNEVDNDEHDPDLTEALAVRDEVIGELSVQIGDGSQEEAKEIISTVAAQLSAHIDNLRLSISNMSLLKSTEERARREQILRQITGTLRSSNNPATIMRTAVRELGSILGRRAFVQLVGPAPTDQAESAASNENKLDAPGTTF